MREITREVLVKLKTILVVGGAGFIGSHVNKMLHDQGYKTVVFDNLSSSSPQPEQLGTLVIGDTGSPEDLDQVFRDHQIDGVMHFAAYIDARESVEQPGKFYQNNVGGSLNLLEAMVRHDVKALIFSSTAAVYGLPQMPALTEEHPKVPINSYGSSKLMVEKILADFDHAHGLQSICLRYFNAAGGDPEGKVVNRQMAATNLIPILLRGLQKPDTVFTLNGTDFETPDGTCVRDYIHVFDLGDAHIRAMDVLLNGGKSDIFNLGNGRGFSIREVMAAVERVTGRTINITEGPRRDGDPPALISDASKAERVLGWKPAYSELDAIIGHAWQAMQAAPFSAHS